MLSKRLVKVKFFVFAVMIFSLFSSTMIAYAAPEKTEEFTEAIPEEVTSIINDSAIAMVAVKNISARPEPDKIQGSEIITAGTIVLADINSFSNNFITIEINGHIFYSAGEAFKAIIGDEKSMLKISEKIKEEFEKANEKKWEKCEKKYPVATYIWRYLQDYGYNDYVIAGILGNIMTKTGGQTLNIKYNIWGGGGNNYYGICQWYQGYGVVADKGLEEQCQFLVETIEQEFNEFGTLSGYTYEEFCNLEDEQLAAKAFAKTYERCGVESISIREANASKALKYFMENQN